MIGRHQWPPRRLLVVVAAVLVAITVLLAWRLRGAVGPTTIDERITDRVVLRDEQGSFRDRSGLHSIVSFASPEVIGIGLLVLAAIAWHHRDRRAIVVIFAGPALAALLAELVLKPLVDRTTPGGDYSFPSATATAFAAACTAVVLVVYRLKRAWAVPALAVGGAAAAAMGMAVVALSWHYATDSLAGCATGCAVVLLLAAVDDAIDQRREAPDQGASQGRRVTAQ
jgi:membrane-associated phospholipid phosphatase